MRNFWSQRQNHPSLYTNIHNSFTNNDLNLIFFLPIALQHAKTILSFSSRKSLILNEFLVFSLKFCFLFRIKSGGTHRMPCGRALLFLILEWPPRTFPFLSFVAQIANGKQFSPVSDLIFWYLIAWFLPWRSL